MGHMSKPLSFHKKPPKLFLNTIYPLVQNNKTTTRMVVVSELHEIFFLLQSHRYLEDHNIGNSLSY